MAPIGRETTDISSRHFVPSFKEQLTEGLWRFMPEHPTDRDHIQRQDALGLAGHFSGAVRNRHGDPARDGGQASRVTPPSLVQIAHSPHELTLTHGE
jgi:hypothetical protein